MREGVKAGERERGSACVMRERMKEGRVCCLCGGLTLLDTRPQDPPDESHWLSKCQTCPDLHWRALGPTCERTAE